MSGTAWLTVAVLAAIWPFGRNRDEEAASGTIRDLEAEVVAVDSSRVIESSEQKAIASYREFLELATADPALEAEAMRRLADLQLESGEAGVALAAAAGADQLAATIALYLQLLEAYPAYAKNDLVLYQLARAYEAAGQTLPALATLDRLVTEYPATPHLAEAQFRRGETLFVEQRYAEAEAAYRSVLAGGDAVPFAEQSLYKLGWSRFKQFRYADSLEPFFGLLDRTLVAGTQDPVSLYASLSRADQELVDDSLRVMAHGFSYLDGPDSIDAFLDRHGPRTYEYIVYTGLGDLYLEQERFQDAAGAYAAFVERDPTHVAAPLAQVEVIEAFRQGGFPDLVLDAKRDFVETYAAGSAYWQGRSFAEQPDVAGHLQRNLTDLAAFHHAAAQDSGARSEYAEAARWYRTWLVSFPDDAAAADTNFLLAEVLFESGSFEAAAIEYERTAYAYPAHAASAEAGLAAQLAYTERQAELDAALAAAWHRQSIDSALRFSRAYPGHAQAAAVQTDAAERLFALGVFDPARDAAADALLVPMTHDLERTAWTVVAHSQFDLGNFAAAESAYLSLTGYLAPDEPARVEINERIASSIYRQGEQARAEGLTDAAVEHFLRVGRIVPGSPIRATAEYDAAAVLVQAGEWTRAAPVLEDFRRQFPEHALAAEATASLAVAYVETGQELKAAGEFERIAEVGASDAIRREALWRAGELFRAAAVTESAAAVLTRYVERYPRPYDAALEARRELAEIAAEQGDTAARLSWLEAIVAVDATAGPERTDRSRFLAAHAQLELAEPARRAFEVSRLVVPLDQSLRLKRERMEIALAAYRKAADYGIAEVTTAATFRLAELYQGLSRDLFESERPAELTGLELSQYDILLEEQAFPFEEQAIELHEVNAARTVDGVYDAWVAESLAALAELMPGRYAKPEKREYLVSNIR
jgi:TolA-binding protein